MADWKPIESAPASVDISEPVDLWLHVHASPRSFGMTDSFRVVDCWRDDETGKWVHYHRGVPTELRQDIITHWMPASKAPESAA